VEEEVRLTSSVQRAKHPTCPAMEGEGGILQTGVDKGLTGPDMLVSRHPGILSMGSGSSILGFHYYRQVLSLGRLRVRI
jgi:hypothetical protein